MYGTISIEFLISKNVFSLSRLYVLVPTLVTSSLKFIYVTKFDVEVLNLAGKKTFHSENSVAPIIANNKFQIGIPIKWPNPDQFVFQDYYFDTRLVTKLLRSWKLLPSAPCLVLDTLAPSLS